MFHKYFQIMSYQKQWTQKKNFTDLQIRIKIDSYVFGTEKNNRSKNPLFGFKGPQMDISPIKPTLNF